MKMSFIIFVIFLLLALIITACSSSPTSTTQQPSVTASEQAATITPKYGGILRVISDTPPSGPLGWPPDMFSTIGVSYALEGLLREQRNGELTPLLAESWTIAPDKMSITFKLRKGVKFHDGTDFNAAAVKFAEEAMMAAKKRPDFKSIEVLDDYTVKFNLVQWRQTILPTFENCDFISPTAYEKNGLDWVKNNPVGTGPYKFQSFTRDVNMVFTRNDNYWQQGKPYPDGIEVKFVVDPMTQKAAMQTGEADVLPVELGKMVADMQAMGGFEVTTQVQTIFSLLPDSANPDSPYADKRVREAVEYAINRDAIASGLGYGMWEAPNQIIPRSNAAYDSSYVGRTYDPAKARQLLTEAGYPNGFKTAILPAPTVLNRDVWVAVQADLKAVGIDAELQFVDFAKYAPYRSGETWHNMMIGEPIAAWGNFDRVLSYWFGPDRVQFKSIDTSMQDWIDAFNASDTAVNMDIGLIQKATSVLEDNALAIPVYEGGRSYAFAPYVKDAGFNTRGMPMWWNVDNVWLDK